MYRDHTAGCNCFQLEGKSSGLEKTFKEEGQFELRLTMILTSKQNNGNSVFRLRKWHEQRLHLESVSCLEVVQFGVIGISGREYGIHAHKTFGNRKILECYTFPPSLHLELFS